MLYLVDASVYIFRAYFSLPDTFRDADGNPAQAVYGFAGFLTELLERENPRHIACAFDESLTTSFRNDTWPDYKANRELPPEELERQLGACRDVAEALGIACFASDRYEADDIIGTLASMHRSTEFPITIVTRDKDLGQLVEPGDTWWDYAGNKRLDVAGIVEKMGVKPSQVPDLLGLMGDSVDNIPGVKGVGAKTAAALLAHFDSLDDLYARLDDVADVPVRGAASLARKLEADRDMAFLSRELATIHCSVPLDAAALDDLAWRYPDIDIVTPLYERLNFGKRLHRQAEKFAARRNA
ncbi:MAG: 5'-3' exonuclease H3TH domain-containing protein [Gammaproteobacteria bacterium]|nr:5'-3' exonuclease H3TH domain-containing protein [Gammaproteobacteria bacterium]